ncbi:MAG: phosphate acetyltransferase [Propionibacteriaceae bacterium]|nr:phosphate acetyltransferase [Propionibacteriaceae bacterium]
MTKSVYLASAERQAGKSAIALGVIEALARQVKAVGVFRPLVRSTKHDPVTEALIGQPAIRQSFEDAVGVSYTEYTTDEEAALAKIVEKFGRLVGTYDAVVILGSDFNDTFTTSEFAINARIAANLNAPVLLVVRGDHRTAADVKRQATRALAELTQANNAVLGVLSTRVAPDDLEAVSEALSHLPDLLVAALPEEPILVAPTVGAQFEVLGATLWQGSEKFFDRESLGLLVGGMTLPNLLTHLKHEVTLIVPSDRLDLLPGLLLAHSSGTFPTLAAIFLSGGYEIPASIQRLFEGLAVELPIGIASGDTLATASALQDLEGIMTSSARKIELARALFARHVDEAALLKAIDVTRSNIRTPLMFEYQLMHAARADRRKIVLPESGDDRILEAASIVLQRKVAKLILLGESAEINRRASELGLNLSRAEIVSMNDESLVTKFAEEYARLRAHKGVTVEQARNVMADPSYFATMMVHFGMADGMVSGAVNTTANTIRPSLEFIKTRPGVKIVSSSFLMCMPDRVLVYADCAVNPDPNPEQLADIAISSAETARSFGIDPKVAMLSYSTGTSGSGADVDKVREATEIVRQRAPELKVEGPIQFDAAVDMTVAQKKMPGSQVAGQATVFIFPDLNTGNNTYKAVQRTSGAIAVGPVLQGLNKPVNDLSRGALVDDIVNTITITAIQAQAQ